MKKILLTVGALFLLPYLMSVSVTAKPQQSGAGIQLVDAKLGKDVKDRQLTDETTDFAVNDKVYLWVKVTGAAGDALKASWKNGDHTYTSDLAVGGSPWRTWCYKIVVLPGDWTVSVADSKGNVLKDLTFKVK